MEGEPKERKVYRIFERISCGYDGANNRISLYMHKRWKMKLVKELTERSPLGESMLDVCCGTGDIAVWTAKRRADLSVTGADFSPSMLKKAEEKSFGMKNITWKKANALRLPFSDNTFYAAVISFGLRNTSDYERVLSEMKRVVKDGGCIYCLDSFVPENAAVRPFYGVYFKYIMPILGGGRRYGKEYSWLYESTQSFLRKKDLIGLYSKIGLVDTVCFSLFFGCCLLVRGQKIKI